MWSINFFKLVLQLQKKIGERGSGSLRYFLSLWADVAYVRLVGSHLITLQLGLSLRLSGNDLTLGYL